jgi:3-isopropylmalate/(R)-2-methylmalate dehydratase large subunit
MGGIKVKNPERIAFFIDHASPAPNQKIANLHAMMREFAKAQGIILHDVGEGVCHQIVAEEGYVVSGDLAMGADSHTCTYGAMGVLAAGIGSTDLAAAMLTGQSWLKVPESIKISFIGDLSEGVYAKDLIIYLVGLFGSDGATYKSIEFYGTGLEKMSLESKMTLCNMVIEMGAKNGIVCDSSTGMKAEEDAKYQAEIEIDLSKLTPYVSKPHAVDNTALIEDVVGIPIHQGFLGSCTNGRIEDIRIAAKILKGKKIAENVRFIVTPASKTILLQAIKEGLIEILVEAGATLVTPGCGACVGTHNGIPGNGETVISSTNRNFKGRMGNNQSFIYLASPATVAASVLYGKITDPRSLR